MALSNYKPIIKTKKPLIAQRLLSTNAIASIGREHFIKKAKLVNTFFQYELNPEKV